MGWLKEIRKLLNERTGRKSKWTEIRCDFFDEEENTGSWMPGKQEMITKKAR